MPFEMRTDLMMKRLRACYRMLPARHDGYEWLRQNLFWQSMGISIQNASSITFFKKNWYTYKEKQKRLFFLFLFSFFP